MKMQKAAMSYIQNNLVNHKEKEKLRKVFNAMDVDFDGRLTKQEIISGLTKMGVPDAKEQAERVFEVADLDGNGYLEFNEWCTATMDKQKLLKRPRLHAPFRMMDKDNSGSISYEELKNILSSQYSHLTGKDD